MPRGDVRVTARGAVDARDWVEHVQSLWRPIRLGAVCVEFPWHREDAPAGGHFYEGCGATFAFLFGSCFYHLLGK